MASNLNQLAKAVNQGWLPLDQDSKDDLRAACEAVQAIRHDLITALGLQDGEGRS